MRVWVTRQNGIETLVDLDDNRLIAQHREAVGMLSMVAGKNALRFSRNPLSIPFQTCHEYLVLLHDECIVEMKFRGWQKGEHASPIIWSKYPNFVSNGNLFIPDPERILFDRDDLTARWLKQSEEFLAKVRKRKLKWTNRGCPEWLNIETRKILEEV